MSTTTPVPTQTLRSILRNGTTPRPSLRIRIPPARPLAATTTADASRGPTIAHTNVEADDTLPPSTLDTPLPSPPLPPPPPPNTPTLRFAPQPRVRPSKRRASRALQSLPYNGALRPKRQQVRDDAHNALVIVDRAERAQLRRKRHSSGTELEQAALNELQTWGPEVWDRRAWDANFVEPDDSTRRGRRRRQPEVV